MDVEKLLNSDEVSTALKWILMILVTGFIAQFGKKFAEYLIERTKNRKRRVLPGKKSKSAVSAPEHRDLPPETTDNQKNPEKDEIKSAPSSAAQAPIDEEEQKNIKKAEKEKQKQQKKIEKARQKELKKKQ